MKSLRLFLITFSFVAAFLISISGYASGKTSIIGAGSTYAAPIYLKWAQEYNKVHPNIEISYQSIGSGGGIKQLTEKTVDFGASDAPMTDDELKHASAPILHIPTVLGAVVLSYNLKDVKQTIKLDGAAIADIFSGKISKWNNARLAALNKGLQLPDVSIVPIYRSDSSGTTAVFTEYLSKISPEWEKTSGHGKTVKWPTGLGGKGNEGVTGQIKNTPGSIGYVELTYATAEKLPMADVKNKTGQFVTPSMKAVAEAANGSLATMPADFRVSITDAEGKTAYPISSFTYILVYQTMTGEKGKEIVDFLNWAMVDGQKSAPSISYVALPTSMLPKVKARIKEIVTK